MALAKLAVNDGFPIYQVGFWMRRLGQRAVEAYFVQGIISNAFFTLLDTIRADAGQFYR